MCCVVYVEVIFVSGKKNEIWCVKNTVDTTLTLTGF